MPKRFLSLRPSSSNRLLPLFIALLSCGISLVLTIKFCLHLNEQADGLWILIALGICWEASKLCFAPAGLRLMAVPLLGSPRIARFFGGVGLLALALVLIGGSIAASMGFLVDANSRIEQQARMSSRQYRDLSAQLESLDQQITLLTDNAAADSAANFRQRALNTSAAISTLRQRRDAVASRLARLEPDPSAASGSTFFTNLATLLPSALKSGKSVDFDADRIRIACHAAIALMLELISIAAVVLARSPMSSTIRDTSTQHVVPVSVSDVAQAPVIRRTQTGTRLRRVRRTQTSTRRTRGGRGDTGVVPGEFDSRYRTAREMILQGQIQPTYRSLRSALQLGQQTATRFIETMIQDGILRREGNRFLVA